MIFFEFSMLFKVSQEFHFLILMFFFTIYRYRRKRPKVDASIIDSALSHTRRSDASEKKKKIARPLLAKLACGQVSSIGSPVSVNSNAGGLSLRKL